MSALRFLYPQGQDWLVQNIAEPEGNFIGNFLYGKFYGTKYNLVKVYDITEKFKAGDQVRKLMKELIFRKHDTMIRHPGIVRIWSHSFDGGVVAACYAIKKPFDTLYNLIPKDSFSWTQRMKVALGLADILKFLHTRPSSFYKPFILHNLDPKNIVLDEHHNPRLCDVGMMTGGIFPDKGSCTDKVDVFAFGVILLGLVTKRVYTDEKWPALFYNYISGIDMSSIDYSLVHDSLASEDGFLNDDGIKVTKMALQCVHEIETQRPSMKQVLKILLQLRVVEQHVEAMFLSSCAMAKGLSAFSEQTNN